MKKKLFWINYVWIVTGFLVITLLVGYLIYGVNGFKNDISEGVVVKVIDGDTFRARIRDREETVRLLGLDAPESVDPRISVECYATESSVFVQKELAGKTVMLERDRLQPNRDEYGRLLRYVFLTDGQNFNKILIEEGMAREYFFRGKEYKYRDEFKEAEARSIEKRLGIWGKCD